MRNSSSTSDLVRATNGPLFCATLLAWIMEQRVVSGTASTIRFDAGDLPAGLYVLQVTDMNAIWTRTLIISNT